MARRGGILIMVVGLSLLAIWIGGVRGQTAIPVAGPCTVSVDCGWISECPDHTFQQPCYNIQSHIYYWCQPGPGDCNGERNAITCRGFFGDDVTPCGCSELGCGDTYPY